MRDTLLCQSEGKGRSSDPAVDFDLAGCPPDLLSDPDWESLNGFVEGAATLCPEVRDVGIRSVQAGWPTFTPDGRFVIGNQNIPRII
jgi:glycine/D-amino acid oxidase-like deaminating enzyme